MDKLHKIRIWLWRNLGKVFLAVAVLVLLFRAYKIIYPEEVERVTAPPPPVGQLPQEVAAAVGDPQPEPEPLPRPNMDVLLSNNPFTVLQGAGSVSRTQERTPVEELGLQVERILPWRNDEHVAMISVRNQSPDRYGEGEQIETLRVERIDAEEETVALRAEDGRVYELKVGG